MPETSTYQQYVVSCVEVLQSAALRQCGVALFGPCNHRRETIIAGHSYDDTTDDIGDRLSLVAGYALYTSLSDSCNTTTCTCMYSDILACNTNMIMTATDLIHLSLSSSSKY